MNALTTRSTGALAPTSMGDMMNLADMLSKSSMVPAAYRSKPQDILVCLLWGNEVGLNPIQALNGIAVINNRPAIWGDAALALVRGHPACQSIREGVEGEGDQAYGWCEVTRRGQSAERRTFSVADAKKAGLWGKGGPWTQYPRRMLQMRARGFAIRDVFPDALRGVITAEEAQDMPAPEVRDVPNLAEPDAGAAAAFENPHAMKSLTFAALDDQLAQFSEAEEIRAYLIQPAVQSARTRAEKAGKAERWSAIVAAHFARVAPEERDGEAEQPDDGWPGPDTTTQTNGEPA